MATLFISYARDDETVAGSLASALEKEGHSVWWDRHLGGGAEYNPQIEEALTSSDKVIVLWSAHSRKSAWVRDEAAAAMSASKLVPLTIDGTDPPLGFRQFHTIDFSGWLAHPRGRLPEKLTQSLCDSLNPARPPEVHGDPERSHHQHIGFARTADGVTIAHSRLGSGPPLVKAGNGYSHLEHELETPLWRHWIDELSSRNTLVRYDQRGTGLSYRSIAELSFDILIDDLDTVVNASGLSRFDLFAGSQGVPVAIAFAARYPERVSRLILVNGYTMGWRHSPDENVVASWDALSVLAKSSRKTPGLARLFANQYFPDATVAQLEWWDKLQEQSTSPEMASRYFDVLARINVVELLKDIRARTLVMHCKGDQVVPLEAGRFVAAQIPGAEFVALDGSNHLPLATDACWPIIQDELRRFLA